MSLGRAGAAALFVLALASLASPSAMAGVTVNVSLWDRGGEMDFSQNMGMGIGMHHNMSMAMVGIRTDRTTVPAGKVTFDVTNTSKGTIHEMIVAPIPDENAQLPFVENEGRVDEEASGDMGEVSELDPGQTGALTLDLKPGLYALFCNVPGHYMAGMWTTIRVQ